ncbi:MAG: Rieske 2Fe-2S domain-containing protein [Saprospiraceae bacterium]
MKRKEFLEKLGVGAAFVLTSTCLGSCSRDMVDEQKDINFTIDLSDNEYEALNDFGAYIIKDHVVIARSISGDYIAATLICSHQSLSQITYKVSESAWFCTAHEALFSEEGEGLNANGSKGLTVFNTELNGNLLRVFS